MRIVMVGLSHKTAPVALRERLALDPFQVKQALQQLRDTFSQARFVLLSTCNRAELYSVSDDDGWDSGAAMVAFLAELGRIPLEVLRSHLYVHVDQGAVEHLFKVTSSLDSLVVGEAQIINQVKDSYRLASAVHAPGKILNRLFHSAFAASKQVHASTTIARGRISVPGVAIELMRQLFADVTQIQALVLGAGDMGELVVKHLAQAGCRRITICNRSVSRGRSLAHRHNVCAVPWEERHERLSQADVVVGVAAVQDVLLDRSSLAALFGRQRRRSLFLLDLAVPRNFDPNINKLDGAYVYSIDDLAEVVEANLENRKRDIDLGLDIVRRTSLKFMEWYTMRDLGPQIGRLKAVFTQISPQELDRYYTGTREACSGSCRDLDPRLCRKSAPSARERAICPSDKDPGVPRPEARASLPKEPNRSRKVNRAFFSVIEQVYQVAREQGVERASQLVSRMVNQMGG